MALHHAPVALLYVNSPIEWQHSSLHRYIQCEKLPQTWGMGVGYVGGEYGEI